MDFEDKENENKGKHGLHQAPKELQTKVN